MKTYIKPSLILVVLIVLGTFVFVGAQQNQNNFNGGGVSITGTTPVAGHVATWASGSAIQDGGAAGSGTVTTSGNLVNNNLLLGAGATVVKDYGSSVLAPANGGVAVSNTASLGGMFVGLDMGWGQVAVGSVQLATAANTVDAVQFVQRYTQTFTRMSTRVRTTFGVASHVGLAIYDSTGTLVPNATTGALDGTNTAGTQVVTVTAVTLTPGIYYLGISTDGASATTGRLDNIPFAVSNAEFTQYTNTAQGKRVVTGATVSAGGVPPGTLGVLSSNVTSAGIPLLWVEP